MPINNPQAKGADGNWIGNTSDDGDKKDLIVSDLFWEFEQVAKIIYPDKMPFTQRYLAIQLGLVAKKNKTKWRRSIRSLSVEKLISVHRFVVLIKTSPHALALIKAYKVQHDPSVDTNPDNGVGG